MIEVIERLVGKGYDLRIYDKNLQLAKLVGANREFVLNRIPHIAALMVDPIGAVLEHGRTIVIGNKDQEFGAIPETAPRRPLHRGFRSDRERRKPKR